MVEGPGCKLKGEKLKSSVVGQKVVGVAGNIIENRPKRDQDKESPYHGLIGRLVTDVRTLGKELFLVLDRGQCVRVHFLMAGYVRYNNQQSDPDEGARKKQPERPRLELALSKDVVGFFLCSVELREREETLERWDSMISLDVCWARFDAVRAADKIMEEANSDRIVADVIMDQEIVPGVGNIIKNEGCFDAGINPLTKITDLSRKHVMHLVKMLRDFSMLFYKCRKTGKPLHKFYKIYRMSRCGQCGGGVTRCKPGEYQRGTYFCAACQTNALGGGPSRNSLLGWAQAGASWECAACTLVNKPGSARCHACTALRGSEPQQPGTASSKPAGLKRKTSSEHSENPHQSCKQQKLADANKVSRTTRSVGNFTFTFKSTRQTPVNTIQNDVPDQVLSDVNIDYNGCETKTKSSGSVNSNHENKNDQVELCKGHKKQCVKKTVSKEGPNKLRLFWTCSLPRAKSCEHFSWADLHHPKCKHDDVTIIREVYKLNENNGRQFYICPRSKKTKCDFFQWVD